LKVILLGPDTNIEKCPPPIDKYGVMINIYVTLDCNSVMILNSFIGQLSEL